MRIAFDTFNLGSMPPCGIKTYTVELIKALASLKPSDQWMPVTYHRKKKYCEGLFTSIDNISIKNKMLHPLSLGREFSPMLKNISPFFERAIARQCDLFHCTNPEYFPFSIPNIAVTIHDLIPLRQEPWVSDKNKSLFKKHIGIVIKRSIALFANSEFTRSEIIGRYPEAEAKTFAIPLAVNNRFTIMQGDRSFLTRHGIPDSIRPYLLYVGQIQTRKNVLSMIKVFESLCERFPDFNLIIIGQLSGGDYPGEVFQLAAQSRFRDRIIFLHAVGDDDIVRFYNHAHAMVFFSLFEGFGLPIIEAMACGCPVVCSRSSSMTEIAEGAAVMIDPYNFDSMRHGMIEIIENQTLRNSLRIKGLERAAGFSWKRTAELTYTGYEQTLSRLRAEKK